MYNKHITHKNSIKRAEINNLKLLIVNVAIKCLPWLAKFALKTFISHHSLDCSEPAA